MKALIVENKKAYYHKKNEGEIVKEPITNISSKDVKNLILYILTTMLNYVSRARMLKLSIRQKNNI